MGKKKREAMEEAEKSRGGGNKGTRGGTKNVRKGKER